MNKSLEEITKEINDLQAEREQENINRINAFGPIFRIQDELGGSVFGITFPKNIHEFDNDAYDQVVYTLLEKMNDMTKIYANKDKYVEDYVNKATNGLSEEDFKRYSEEIRNSLKAIKISNSKLNNIWEKQNNLGKLKSARLSETNSAGEKNMTGVPVVKAQIENLQAEISKLEQDIKLNEAQLAKAQNDEIRALYADVISATKKLIAVKKGAITKLYKVVSKEDIEYFDKMQADEAKKEEERKLEEEKAAKEKAKQDKFAEIRKAKETATINKELDKAEGIEEPKEEGTPQQALDEQIKVDTTPEKPKKCTLIKRAGEFLKKIVNSNITKTVAVLAATTAGILAGLTFAPGVMLGAAGILGYQEIKKGMGK